MTDAAAHGLPLDGVRVVDLSRVLAGPQCAMALGDLGADVVKVEHPSRGDDTRDWGRRIGGRETSYFYSVNRNKRSVAADLGTEEGRLLVARLCRKADVVIENFKTGDMERFGLGYEALKAENPGLIYCAISGYGRTGVEGERPGYDLVVQGEAGLMAMNGEAGQTPLKFGVAVVDMVTGLSAAQAILACLFDRARGGPGRRIDMALYDCGVSITAYYGLEALLLGEDPPKYGNAHPAIVPYGVFDCADGPIVLTVGNNAQFARFCALIGRPELATDPRFETNLLRARHREALLPELEAALRARPRRALLAGLAKAKIPSGEVLGLHEALAGPRAAAAGLVARHVHPEAGETTVLAPPYRIDGRRPPVRRPPPRLGEHGDEIARDLAARRRSSPEKS